MGKILTVVVPSYNVDAYIQETLNNMTQSSFFDDLEILVIDDGSTDSTYELAHFFEVNYPNSIKVIRKQNGGHGSTINTGIRFATGKYFKIVDADDWLQIDQLDQLIPMLKYEEADLVVTPYYTYDDVNGTKKLINNMEKIEYANELRKFDDISMKYIPNLHENMVKTAILQNNPIIIDENAYYVDYEYVIYQAPFVKTYKYINIPILNYRINVGTQSTSNASMLRNSARHEFIIDQIQKFIKEYQFSSSIKVQEIMIRSITRMIGAQYKIISLGTISRATYNQLVQFDRKVRKEYLTDFSVLNLPIKGLTKFGMAFYPVIHLMAKFKEKVVRV